MSRNVISSPRVFLGELDRLLESNLKYACLPSYSSHKYQIYEQGLLLGKNIDDKVRTHKEYSRLFEDAKSGDVFSQLNLAILFCLGEGGPKNNEQALHWIRIVARNAPARDQFNLGLMCSDSVSGCESPDILSVLHRLVVDRGDLDAQRSLGIIDLSNQNFNQSREIMHNLDLEALNPANNDAKRLDAKYLIAVRDETNTETIISKNKTSEERYIDAQYLLAVLYEDSHNDCQLHEVIQRYEQAANSGHFGAQVNLGFIHATCGNESNIVEADRWFDLASQSSTLIQHFRDYFILNEQLHSKEVMRQQYNYLSENGLFDSSISLNNKTNFRSIAISIRNDSQAMRRYLFFAQKGVASAQVQLGFVLSVGKGVQRNYFEAFKWYRLAALQGERQAQFSVGVMYEKGRGVPHDDTEAFKWYRLAARQGCPISQFNLSFMYSIGQGTGQDDGNALKWLFEAAKNGFGRAAYSLGKQYEHGHGLVKDEEQAIKCYRIAARLGLAQAQLTLGIKYDLGNGTSQNDMLAIKWYYRAAKAGNMAAKINLQVIFEEAVGIPRTLAQGVRWFPRIKSELQIRACLGDEISQFWFAYLCEHGLGYRQDYQRSLTWYRRAERQGSLHARFRIGLMYLTGNDFVQKDTAVGRRLIMSAINNGLDQAIPYMDLLPPVVSRTNRDADALENEP